jgi:hypothetical protein
MDNLKGDVAYAVRSLAAAPKFTVVVIATLALGLGANTAVFSVLDAVVLRPLPSPGARSARPHQPRLLADVIERSPPWRPRARWARSSMASNRPMR